MSEGRSSADRGMVDISLRVDLGPEGRVGPGKVALLERIAETGSISAAGRAIGMSYRRAWTLVAALNALFDEPVVTTAAGGAHGGGAELTGLGRRLVTAYRAAEASAEREVATGFAEIVARLAPRSPPEEEC